MTTDAALYRLGDDPVARLPRTTLEKGFSHLSNEIEPAVVRAARALNLFSLVIVLILTGLDAYSLLTGRSAGEERTKSLYSMVVYPLGALFMVWLITALRQRRRSAWRAQAAWSVLSLVSFPVGTVLNGLLLVWWFRRDTRAWFGLGEQPADPEV